MENPRPVRVALWLGLLLMHTTLLAHPHHWIDVFTEWQFDGDGVIQEVKLRWLFDDYYSILLVQDLAATEEKLEEVLHEVLHNAATQDYFLQIEQEGRKVGFGKPGQARIRALDHRIEIEFRLPMLSPLNPKRGDIVYRVAEPTYYFEMLHAEDIAAIVLQDAPTGCRYRIEAPRLDAALIAQAAALGVDEDGGNGLGIQFAEKVTIRCE